MIHHVHTQLISANFIELNDEEYVEYSFDDGAKVRILIPEGIEEVNCAIDPNDSIEIDDPNDEEIPGFTCYKCGAEQIPLIDGISGAVPSPFAALPQHIEECLGLEPIETEESSVTTIQYS